MKPGVDIGPAISESQLETNLKYIGIGAKEVGKPLCGGERLTGTGPNGEDLSKGFFCSPTVFANVSNDATIAQEEIFGPVLAIVRAKDFTEAMTLANATPLGLSASVQTTNVSRVFDFVNQMEAGLLTVNLPSAGVEYQLPFGGTKDSSFGPKEQGPAALEFYSDYKTVYLKY
jgi:aldehyde dehydrogenase (NAD+)